MLYEFGLTATVAIMVSMLVSFTLTPMMCSKLLRPAKPREGDQTQQAAASRRGPYAWIETAYMVCLRASMKFRWAVLILVVLTILANWPLYQLVQQDYIPTNVDESEFEVSLTAPEGASLASMDDALRHVESQIREIPGVELLLVTVGTRGFGGVNRGEFYVRLSDIEGRSFSLGRLGREFHAARQNERSPQPAARAERLAG
jgi:HAE1 family hydrophobic/amphiphilic exporter-1